MKKLNAIVSNCNCNFICKNCLNSHTCQIMFINQKEKFEQNKRSLILKLQMNLIFFGKRIFIRILYILRFFQIFKLIMKLIILVSAKKQLLFVKKNPVLNGYYKISKLNDVLNSGYYRSNLDFDKVDWFVDEVIKLEVK